MKLALIEDGRVTSVRAVDPMAAINVVPGQWVEVTTLSVCPSVGWRASHDAASGWTFAAPDYAAEAAEAQAARLAALTADVQLRLDEFARSGGYDSILSACTYATSAVPKFKREGAYCVQARDATWAAAYGVLDAVQAGTRAMPASIADIERDLPALTWPV